MIGHKYSTTIFDSINQLLGTDYKGFMTATYPAYGNKNGIYLKFKEANEILLFGNPDTCIWRDEVSFVTKNKPDALEGSQRIIHLFLKECGYYVWIGKHQFDKRDDDIIYLKTWEPKV